MPKRTELSPAYLRQRLRYEPATGKLYWRVHEPHGPQWNGRYAGTEAFTADDGRGYKQGSIDDQLYAAHRIVWAMVHDQWPDDQLDHRDHDRCNNRIGNLREASDGSNRRNQTQRKDNTSGATGVTWDKQTSKWFAQIGVAHRCINLGRFTDLDDAVAARKAAEIRFGFDENHGAPREVTIHE